MPAATSITRFLRRDDLDDAPLSPAIAAGIDRQFPGLEAHSVRSLGLRDAYDEVIFDAAKKAGVVVMNEDADFRFLLERHGPQPVIWITCGNTSNQHRRDVLGRILLDAVSLLVQKSLIEISDRR